MTAGRTFWDWGGKPAISQDGQARYVETPGGPWVSSTDVTLATLGAQAVNVGQDRFYARFAGDPWNLPDLDGWYSSPATLAAQPFNWAAARFYASR